MEYIVKPCNFDYNTNKKIIEDLIKEYPFLSVQVIGRTALGRGIFSLNIGNNKNSVIYVGTVHGSNRLTGLLLLLFAERLCHSIKHGHLLCSVDIKKAFSQLGVTIIPCLNPDGAEISAKGIKGARSMGSFVSSFSQDDIALWRANAMGVDINCNFHSPVNKSRELEEEKGSSFPSPSFYGGEYPESEAETKALTRLCRMKSFRQCLDIHTGGDEIILSAGENEPAQSSMMAKILACSSSCNLTSAERDDCNGIRNWFTDEFSRPAFTMKTGKVENPLPEELYAVYEKIEEALTVFALM